MPSITFDFWHHPEEVVQPHRSRGRVNIITKAAKDDLLEYAFQACHLK